MTYMNEEIIITNGMVIGSIILFYIGFSAGKFGHIILEKIGWLKK